MTSPAQLSDYEASVSNIGTLGYIAWYSLPDPQITADDLAAKATASGVATKHLPGSPRPADAFKRAVRKIDLLKTRYYAIPNSENKLSMMVRPVVSAGDELEAHLVAETLDPQGKTLSHEDLVRFKFKVSDNRLNAEDIVDPMPNRDIVDEHVTKFIEMFITSKKHVEPQAIRNMFRQELWDMDALNVRSRGGIYFVPYSSKNQMVALETFASSIGATFHTLPLPDTTKQKDMLVAAFEEDVHSQAYETMEALDKVLNSGGKMPPSVWARHKKRFDDLTNRASQYSDIVDSELEKAGTELLMLQTKITEVLNGDYISEGRGGS